MEIESEIANGKGKEREVASSDKSNNALGSAVSKIKGEEERWVFWVLYFFDG